MEQVSETAPKDYALAVELVECRSLIKGYSGTHARGLANYDRVIAAAHQLFGRSDAADWTRRLRHAALSDEDGAALEGAIRTVDEFLNSVVS
jgi:indolepyruvate ferredoxin oxidoreductase beta subunit